MAFHQIPANATLQPKPFTAHASDQDLDDFRQLVKLSKIGPKTYENLNTDVKDFRSFGISREWLSEAKSHWHTQYDWRKTEARINALPNFTVQIEDDGYDFEIHFAALFSSKIDAAPLVLLHGWPGSFLEFVSTLEVLKAKYTPETLPFSVVVPSLPGYAYSSGPSIEKTYNVEGMSRVIDKLMIGLGFGDGYIAQGGDIGSFITRVLGATSESCKAAHLHLCIGKQSTNMDGVTDAEKVGLARMQAFSEVSSAYANEHGTRPATIGLALSASPIALLAWIGEKFLQWSDVSPPQDEILDSVTLYWLTDSFPRCIFPYRQFFGNPPRTFFHNDEQYYIKKPMGYSWHHKELAPTPQTWVAETGNLVFWRAHMEGGHFAAMEKPELFIKDMEAFVADVWPTAKNA